MKEIIVKFKSGKEYRFKCEYYRIETRFGELFSFSYEGGIGECPIYFKTEDIESIAKVIE